MNAPRFAISTGGPYAPRNPRFGRDSRPPGIARKGEDSAQLRRPLSRPAMAALRRLLPSASAIQFVCAGGSPRAGHAAQCVDRPHRRLTSVRAPASNRAMPMTRLVRVVVRLPPCLRRASARGPARPEKTLDPRRRLLRNQSPRKRRCPMTTPAGVTSTAETPLPAGAFGREPRG
jgi:hypothetical protein